MSDTLTIADIEMVLRGLMAIAQQDSGALDEIARLMGKPEFPRNSLASSCAAGTTTPTGIVIKEQQA